MKLEEKNCTIRCASFREFKGFACLIGALALAVVASLSVAAQIVPGPPTLLNTNATSDSGSDTSPQVTTDGAGNWVAVWESNEDLGGTAGRDTDIFVATSTNNGATWTAPALLNSNGTSDPDGEKNERVLGGVHDVGPQVTTDGSGNWVAVWYTIDDMNQQFDGVFVARSTDNGLTWTAPALLSTETGPYGSGSLPQVATDGAGNWVAVWYSIDIFAARSTNNGETWTAPLLLNTSVVTEAGSSGVDSPQVTTDGAGNWVAVWWSDHDLNGTGTDGDIYIVRSTNNGDTWTAPTLLNTNGTTDSLYDGEINPQVTTDGAGNWVAVWGSSARYNVPNCPDIDMFVINISAARSTNNGETWTAPTLLNTNGASGSRGAPQVTADGAGNWVAVWKSTVGVLGGGEPFPECPDPDLDIFATGLFAATSTDSGATWTAPVLLNTNGVSASLRRPQVATDGAGNWVAVWTSTEDLGGTAGTDWDIFVASFALGAAESGGSSGNCFIATAAYGTPMAEEINSLKAVRDAYMLSNALGAAFVDTYYRVSPPIADSIAKREGLRAVVRLLLSPTIVLSNGALAAPYTLAALALVLALAGTWVVLKRRRGHEH